MWDPRSYRDTDYGLRPDQTFEPKDAVESPEADTSQPHVMTVLGAVEPDELGVALAGEHLICAPYPDDPDDERNLVNQGFAAQEVEAFATVGGRTILELSTPDIGREVTSLRWLSQRVPSHIIAVTGRRLGDGTPSPARDALANAFIEEIRDGIAGTQVKAGAILISPPSANVFDARQVTEAALTASAETGAPLFIEVEYASHASSILEAVTKSSAPNDRVSLIVDGPAWRRVDLQNIASAGAHIAVSGIGKQERAADYRIAEDVVALADAGHASQILLAHGLSRRSEMFAHGGAPGLGYILEHFSLHLMEAGASAELVRELLVTNPARALTIITRSSS